MLKGLALKGRIFKPKDITKHLFFIDFFGDRQPLSIPAE